MANILLTPKCVRACPYCFAKKYLETASSKKFFSWEDLIYVVDLVAADGKNHVSLLGGEPTLHPDFSDFIIYLMERDFGVSVFTSGIMSESALKKISVFKDRIPHERLSFICNINHPKTYKPAETESLKKFLTIFGSYTSASFNIYEPNFDMDFLFQYINSFGLKRQIRMSFAHPIFKMNNAHIKIEDMKRTIERLFHYMPTIEKLNIKPGFDCGFTMCLFSDEQLGRIFKIIGHEIKFGCGPAIDIGPDMEVWCCFPLYNFNRKSVFEFTSIKGIYDYYMSMQEKVRSEVGGIFEDCDNCKHREEKRCSAGCVAHILKSFDKEQPIRRGFIDETTHNSMPV